MQGMITPVEKKEGKEIVAILHCFHALLQKENQLPHLRHASQVWKAILRVGVGEDEWYTNKCSINPGTAVH